MRMTFTVRQVIAMHVYMQPSHTPVNNYVYTT